MKKRNVIITLAAVLLVGLGSVAVLYTTGNLPPGRLAGTAGEQPTPTPETETEAPAGYELQLVVSGSTEQEAGDPAAVQMQSTNDFTIWRHGFCPDGEKDMCQLRGEFDFRERMDYQLRWRYATSDNYLYINLYHDDQQMAYGSMRLPYQHGTMHFLKNLINPPEHPDAMGVWRMECTVIREEGDTETTLAEVADTAKVMALTILVHERPGDLAWPTYEYRERIGTYYKGRLSYELVEAPEWLQVEGVEWGNEFSLHWAELVGVPDENVAPVGQSTRLPISIKIYPSSDSPDSEKSVIETFDLRLIWHGFLFDDQRAPLAFVNIPYSYQVQYTALEPQMEWQVHGDCFYGDDPHTCNAAYGIPDGLWIEDDQGIIHWTPKASQIGRHDLAVGVYDLSNYRWDKRRTIEIEVREGIMLPEATEGETYKAALDVEEGWSYAGLVESELPPGLEIPPSIYVEGSEAPAPVIQGTPTQAGSYDFILRLESAGDQTNDRRYGIVVAPMPVTALPDGTFQEFYEAELEVKDMWQAEAIGGRLPDGLSVSTPLSDQPFELPGMGESAPPKLSGVLEEAGDFEFVLRFTPNPTLPMIPMSGAEFQRRYTLHVSPPPPDFSVTVEPQQITWESGDQEQKVFTIHVTDLNGYTGRVFVTADLDATGVYRESPPSILEVPSGGAAQTAFTILRRPDPRTYTLNVLVESEDRTVSRSAQATLVVPE